MEYWDGVEAWTYVLALVLATVVLTCALARLRGDRRRERKALEDRFLGVLWRLQVVEGRLFTLERTINQMSARDWIVNDLRWSRR